MGGVVSGLVEAGGLTWPAGAEAVDGPAGVAAGLDVASGVERTSEPADVVAAVLGLAPVEATSWPDHQSFDIRCFGDAFR